MTNHFLGSVTARTRLARNGHLVAKVLLATGIFALVILTALSLNTSGPDAITVPSERTNRSALPDDGRAYFTEPYWEMAKEAESAAPAIRSALPDDGRAYFTEPYWEMGRSAETGAADPVEPEREWSYYTERYWEKAGE